MVYKNDVRTSAMTAASSGPAQHLVQRPHLPFRVQSISGTTSFSLFDYMVTGLIVFALLLQVSFVAGQLVKGRSKRERWIAKAVKSTIV